jgi:hypothetical protein
MAIEETFRDWHHHWAVRAATVSLPTEAMVTRLGGIVCIAYTLQMLVGYQVSCTPHRTTPPRPMDGHGANQLVLVRPARLYRSRLRLEHLAHPTVGESRTTVASYACRPSC